MSKDDEGVLGASPYNRSRPRRRPYGSSEVIHRSGAKAGFELWSVSDARL
jgi:hypothetical protein